MNTKLICRYDPIGDILYIDQCSPYADQESEEMDDEIIGSSGKDMQMFRVNNLIHGQSA